MTKVARLSLVLALSAALLAPAVAGSAPACAAEAAGAPHAALVVGTGGGTTTYCVALDGSSVSGIHLIQLAGSQFGLQYRLGFGGQAVCQLAGLGPSGGDCFAGYPNFWGYWHGDGHGGWSWAGSGAASASVGDGDMEGWVYGSGDSGATHAAPPALAFEDVCEPTAPPDPPSPPGDDGAGGSGGGSGDGDGSGSGNGSTGGSAGDDPAPEQQGAGPSTDRSGDASSDRGTGGGDRSDGGAGDETPTPVASPTVTRATPVTQVAGAVTGDQSGGPPLGALLALAAIAALGAGGWFLRRRRETPAGRPGTG